MTYRMDPRISALADKRADFLTLGEIVAAQDAISADPRVSHVEYAGRPYGRPSFEICARDTKEGKLAGIHSVGRILRALQETEVEHAKRVSSTRAAHANWAREAEEARAAEDAEREAEKAANARRLFSENIPPARLGRIAACLISGSNLPDEDLEDWAWYEREIVRGRPQPLALHLYVAGFVRS